MEAWDAREFENANQVIEQTSPDSRTVRILVPDHIARSFIANAGYADVDMPMYIGPNNMSVH